MEYIINEAEAKAAVFDLIKKHILDEDFEELLLSQVMCWMQY